MEDRGASEAPAASICAELLRYDRAIERRQRQQQQRGRRAGSHRSSGSNASCSAAFHSSSVILFQSFLAGAAFFSELAAGVFLVDLAAFLAAAASTQCETSSSDSKRSRGSRVERTPRAIKTSSSNQNRDSTANAQFGPSACQLSALLSVTPSSAAERRRVCHGGRGGRRGRKHF